MVTSTVPERSFAVEHNLFELSRVAEVVDEATVVRWAL